VIVPMAEDNIDDWIERYLYVRALKRPALT
jgi:hypothetical protein